MCNKAYDELKFRRIIYPTFFRKHFTIVALDTPNSQRLGRMSFFDPLMEHPSQVQSAFEFLFKHRKLKHSNALCHGGLQENNTTECGIFAMRNLDALLEAQIFFSIKDWSYESETRDVHSCALARKKYGNMLRQHAIEYACNFAPISLRAIDLLSPQDTAAVSAVAPGDPPAQHVSTAAAAPGDPPAQHVSTAAAAPGDPPAQHVSTAAAAPGDPPAQHVSTAAGSAKKKSTSASGREQVFQDSQFRLGIEYVPSALSKIVLVESSPEQKVAGEEQQQPKKRRQQEQQQPKKRRQQEQQRHRETVVAPPAGTNQLAKDSDAKCWAAFAAAFAANAAADLPAAGATCNTEAGKGDCDSCWYILEHPPVLHTKRNRSQSSRKEC
jgi:hypothetical protein